MIPEVGITYSKKMACLRITLHPSNPNQHSPRNNHVPLSRPYVAISETAVLPSEEGPRPRKMKKARKGLTIAS